MNLKSKIITLALLAASGLIVYEILEAINQKDQSQPQEENGGKEENNSGAKKQVDKNRNEEGRKLEVVSDDAQSS